MDLSLPPLLVVELPVPSGHEEEWNRWYHQEHMPDVLRSVHGVVRSCRYQVVAGDDAYRYVVHHEFDSVENLVRYHGSTQVQDRWRAYERRWGMPAEYRRRALAPLYGVGPHR